MPDEHGIPTDEEIEKWRNRWRGENAYRVEDVVRVLQENPKWGAKKIVELDWYNEENGFERWLTEEKENEHLLEGREILDFRGCHFPDNVDIRGADLRFSHFEGARFIKVNLSRAWLKGANFSRASLRWTRLSEAVLHRANFQGADLRWAQFLRAGIEEAQFIDCKLRGIDLYSPVGFAACHPNTFFGRTKGKRKKKTPWLFTRRILKKQELLLEHAIDICSEIRLCFRANGLFHKAAIYYEQEEYWRTRAKLRGSLKDKVLGALRLFFFEWMIGYGERPQRIIAWSFGVLIICALIFCGCGFQYETSPGVFESMKYSAFAPFSGEAWMNYFRCLRFSIENFTTLGFSKMQPAEGISHWVASLEGVVGVLFVALATVTWARKAIRD